MTSLTILLMAGLAAMAVLLACLKGFSKALRYKKVAAVFLSVEGREERLPESRSKTLIDFPQQRMSPSGAPVPGRVCSGTVALVEMAILLGSRSAYSGVPAGSSDPKGARLRRRTSVQLTGVQPLSNS